MNDETVNDCVSYTLTINKGSMKCDDIIDTMNKLDVVCEELYGYSSVADFDLEEFVKTRESFYIVDDVLYMYGNLCEAEMELMDTLVGKL